VMGFFEIGSPEAQRWLQIMILLISVSWVARITDVSHWRPAKISILYDLEGSVWWLKSPHQEPPGKGRKQNGFDTSVSVHRIYDRSHSASWPPGLPVIIF
jgi:hypothetical protein